MKITSNEENVWELQPVRLEQPIIKAKNKLIGDISNWIWMEVLFAESRLDHAKTHENIKKIPLFENATKDDVTKAIRKIQNHRSKHEIAMRKDR